MTYEYIVDIQYAYKKEPVILDQRICNIPKSFE